MLRLPFLQSLSGNIQLAGVHKLLTLVQSRSFATNTRSEATPDIPDQWRNFMHTAPVPEELSANTTAFSWARKQAPELSLALLGKFFKQRQVRVLQHGQVKRVTRSRSLEPGDVLLLPRQLQQAAASPKPAARQTNPDARQAAWPAVLQQQLGQHARAAAQQQQQQQPDTDEVILEQQLIEWEQHLPDPWPQQMPNSSKLLPMLQQQYQQQQQDAHKEDLQQSPESASKPWQRQQQKAQQQQQHQEQPLQQQQQQLTVQQIRKWIIASSADIAVLNKPPGISLQVQQGLGPPQLNPILAEALNVKAPERPQLVCNLGMQESGAVVISRHAVAQEWLSAWVAGEPAALAAATASLVGDSSRGRVRASSARARQQREKLQRLKEAAAAAKEGSSACGIGAAAAAAAGAFTAKELAGLRQLFEAVGGLRLQRVFWALVQGSLHPKQSGTLRNRMLRGDLALPATTRYRVLASRGGLSWLELQPITSRPNQIRVHCGKVLGAPIVGDFKYGYRPWPSAGHTRPASQQQARSAAATAAAAAAAAGLRGSLKVGDHLAAAEQHWREAVGAVDAAAGGAGASVFDDFVLQQSPWGSSQSANDAAVEPLMLHCREVLLLRPRKAPIKVVAPLPRGMRQLLHDMGWK